MGQLSINTPKTIVYNNIYASFKTNIKNGLGAAYMRYCIL